MTEMVVRTSLDDHLHHPVLLSGSRIDIINHLWGLNDRLRDSESNNVKYDSYFAYYTEQCKLALHDGGRHVSARTHRDILQVVQHIREPLSRISIREKLCSQLKHRKAENENEVIDGSIDLAVRLYTMMDFGDLPYAFSGRKMLDWKESRTLQDFIGSYLPSVPVLSSEGIKLQKMFNARNLGQIAGIEVIWTTNLADHLRMVDEDKRVAIFSHVSFLELHKITSIFPDGFIEETFRTHALLFPESDKDIRKWIRNLPPIPHLDRRVRECGHLRADDRQIQNFRFWHDRIVILKQVFDEAEPSTLSHWWYDRRKGTQWYTFWIAAVILAFTIFFGVVQCVEGALQVYEAFVPPR